MLAPPALAKLCASLEAAVFVNFEPVAKNYGSWKPAVVFLAFRRLRHLKERSSPLQDSKAAVRKIFWAFHLPLQAELRSPQSPLKSASGGAQVRQCLTYWVGFNSVLHILRLRSSFVLNCGEEKRDRVDLCGHGCRLLSCAGAALLMTA